LIKYELATKMKFYYNVGKLIVIAIITLSLQACGILAGFLGASPSLIQLAQTADAAKLATDIISASETGATSTDHLVSIVMKMECRSSRFLRGDRYCQRICS
jgi:hypothetical protein